MPAEDRLLALLADVEAKQLSPSYCGVYDLSLTYSRGSLTTYRGGLWLAVRRTGEVPGHGQTAWELIVKSGQAEGATS